ncbi:MAG TPA: hypothetical protein VEV18_02740, partial [Steroidobacteraceae bacterium]|nr:hypothetical protein [Steroidobacteraceae bacterium]
LDAEPGMNRFVWDLRYDPPVQIPGAFYAGLPPRGPIALPGDYAVRLTAGGRTQSVPLTMAPDPRVKTPLTGLEQKFALSMQVYRDQDRLHRAVNDIRAVKAGVQETLHAAGTESKAGGESQRAKLTTSGDKLFQRAAGIEGQLMQVEIKGSEANLNFPGMLNEQIYSFSGLLEDADTAPNQQEIDTYAGLHSRLEAQLADWAALKRAEVADFCARARSEGQGGIPASVCP